MKKSSSVIIGVIIVIVLVVAGFAIFHKSSKTASNSSPAKTTASVNNAVLTTKTDATLGRYLATPAGLPLYTYAADSSGVSNCTGSCLTTWPVYQDTGSTAGLPSGVSTLKRTDNGETQYTYNGMPLYTFTGDSAGKVNGNGVENFSIATPVAITSSQAAPAASSSSSSNSSSSYPY